MPVRYEYPSEIVQPVPVPVTVFLRMKLHVHHQNGQLVYHGMVSMKNVLLYVKTALLLMLKYQVMVRSVD